MMPLPRSLTSRPARRAARRLVLPLSLALAGTLSLTSCSGDSDALVVYNAQH